MGFAGARLERAWFNSVEEAEEELRKINMNPEKYTVFEISVAVKNMS